MNIIDAASDINFIDSENVMEISLDPSDFILKEEQSDSDKNQVTPPPLVIDELEPEKEKNSVQNETRRILNNPEDFSASLQESQVANTVTHKIKRKYSDNVREQSKTQRLNQVPVLRGRAETGAWINYRGNDRQQASLFNWSLISKEALLSCLNHEKLSCLNHEISFPDYSSIIPTEQGKDGQYLKKITSKAPLIC